MSCLLGLSALSPQSNSAELTVLSGKIEMLRAIDIQFGKEVPTKFPAIKLSTSHGDLPIGSELQLATIDSDQYKAVKSFVGKKVDVFCSEIFDAESAHHFTKHLCFVDRISEAKLPPTSSGLESLEPRPIPLPGLPDIKKPVFLSKGSLACVKEDDRTA